MKKGKLYIISGPSGVGKSTIRESLLKLNKNIWFSISMTTRPPRDNEEDKVDYYFVSNNEFLNHVANNNLIEYVEVYKGVFYGTPRNIIEKKLKQGKDVLLEIDVDGALKVKKQYEDAYLIFIKPPTIEELEKRLKNRNTDTPQKIKERLEKANYEIEKSKDYDFIVTNDNIDDTVNEINNYIMSR